MEEFQDRIQAIAQLPPIKNAIGENREEQKNMKMCSLVEKRAKDHLEI